MKDSENAQAVVVFSQRIDRVLGQDRLFAVLPDGPLDTAELRARVSSLAQSLLNHTAPDACVGILSKTDRHVIAAVITCLRIGHPFLICDPEAPIEETSNLLKHSGAAILFCEADVTVSFGNYAGLCVLDVGLKTGEEKTLPPVAPSSTAMLVATSGTTDRPKIVELTYVNLRAQFAIFADVYGFDAETRALNLLPFHHVDGLIRGPLLALWFDATLLRPRMFSVAETPAILDDLNAQNATHLITVPAMLRILHRAQDPEIYKVPQSLRFILSSADYLDVGLWKASERDFGVPVVNAYGLSEVVCDALIAGPDDATRIAGTIGAARGVGALVLGADGAEVADGETGELAISGDTVMRGYVGDPESTAQVMEEDVFRTGDLVRKREDGLFDYMGRQKNVVVVGGVTIHPEAVTEVLASFPGVAEAYAFGNQTETGEVLLAAVCPLPGVQLEPEAMYAASRAQLAPERQPSKIVILPELPRRSSGKVDRNAIIAAAAAKNGGTSVQGIAAECFGVSVADLSVASTPFDTPGWDSLAHMEFIEMLEERFDFTMSPMDVAGMMSIGDAIEIVEREIG